jgi:hypothetical protein
LLTSSIQLWKARRYLAWRRRRRIFSGINGDISARNSSHCFLAVMAFTILGVGDAPPVSPRTSAHAFYHRY